jgi:hypothetical protein
MLARSTSSPPSSLPARGRSARDRTVSPPFLSPPFLPVALAALVLVAGCGFEEPAFDDLPAPGENDVALGTVDFPTSCSEQAQPPIEQGLLLLHHMMYVEAEEAFSEAVHAEESCAMAHWGVAMSRFQPFWGSASLDAGREAAQQAVAAQPPTERERLYVESALAFFEPPEATYGERLRAWESAKARLHDAFPDDPEAATLYALAHLSVAPDDPDRQDRAAEIVERVHALMPEHPGAIHYGIHIHDVDARVDDGLHYAHAYEDLAPSIPHALHMPSHLYVRTGDWEEVIEWNRRSADAALEHPAGDYISLHYPHALDYLAYAFLQLGQDDRALEVREELAERQGYEPHMASAYALAAIPARWYVERRDWAGAAELEPRVPADFPWDAYPAAEAMSWFARGLGAARTGDADGAARAGQRLAELESLLEEAGDAHWERQVRVQRWSVEAWRALAEGRTEEALDRMQAAAELEGSMEKHPITPGALQPAHELLGDLLVAMNQPADALEAYRASLSSWPRRYNTLLGAARSAEEAGRMEAAETYAAVFEELAAEAHPERERIETGEADGPAGSD